MSLDTLHQCDLGEWRRIFLSGLPKHAHCYPTLPKQPTDRLGRTRHGLSAADALSAEPLASIFLMKAQMRVTMKGRETTGKVYDRPSRK